ncbi:MAG TPA: hypothetical protein VFM93_00505 [Candidatus Limnocylindria bacterium]|nr:hypothetical protein [Candidatus Limnocylindria bacterium]
MSRRAVAVWIVANVAGAAALGLLACVEPSFPPILPGLVFGAAQTIPLVGLRRALVAWFPVTAVVTPAAIFVSAVFVARSVTISLDTPSPEPGAFRATVDTWLLSLPGWVVLGAAQAMTLRAAGLRHVWWWVVAVAVGGLGLVPLGAATVARGGCQPLAAAGGPAVWLVGGAWYAAATSYALRRIVRPRSPRPGYLLFHAIGSVPDARVRREIAARGIKPLIDFRNVVQYPEEREALHRLGGTSTPALWDGERLVEGEDAVLLALGAIIARQEGGA